MHWGGITGAARPFEDFTFNEEILRDSKNGLEFTIFHGADFTLSISRLIRSEKEGTIHYLVLGGAQVGQWILTEVDDQFTANPLTPTLAEKFPEYNDVLLEYMDI